VHDEQIARWNQQRGPRVGDWCETKDGGLHRSVRGGRIRLASPSGRFSLGSEGVTYFGIFIDHPAVPTSSLLKQPERKPGAIHQPRFTVDCLVSAANFDEAKTALGKILRDGAFSRL
jgi:hypothetical protein